MTTETKTPDPLERSPDDWCRMCRGNGGWQGAEQSAQGRISTWTPCTSCRGTGWGH